MRSLERFNKIMAKLKTRILGYKRFTGTYNGNAFDTYHLYVAHPVYRNPDDKICTEVAGFDVQTIKAKKQALDDAGIDIDALVNNPDAVVRISFDKFKNFQSIELVSVNE